MRTSLDHQLSLPMPPPYQTPRIGMIACFICGRPISIWFSRTQFAACKHCTAVHEFIWYGGVGMPKFSAVVQVPGDIPEEYLRKHNIPVPGEDEEFVLDEDPSA